MPQKTVYFKLNDIYNKLYLMKARKLIIAPCIFSLLFLNISCNNNSSNNNSNNNNNVEYYYSEYDGYKDGTYCADVTYYNPNTGTNNTYTLEVEVENNELITIFWGNGGWLDEDHFSAETLDDNGNCSFTSDKGYEYEIQITGVDCGFTDQTTFQYDVEKDEEDITCPICGDEKSEYDEYCYSCEREIEDKEENTCSRCGRYEYGVYGGLCSNCQDEDEEEND